MKFLPNWVLSLLLLFPASIAISGPIPSRDRGFRLAVQSNPSSLSTNLTPSTRLVATADYDHSGLLLVAPKNYDGRRLLQLAKSMVGSIGRRNVTFTPARNGNTNQVQIAFDSFVRVDGGVSHSELPIGRCVEYLEKSDLPKPISVAILLPTGACCLVNHEKMLTSTWIEGSKVGKNWIYHIDIARAFPAWASVISLATISTVFTFYAFWQVKKVRFRRWSAALESSFARPITVSDNA